MDPQALAGILARLRASHLAELAGAVLSLTIPVPERLLNEIVTALVPSSAPVRGVSIQPRAGDRLRVSATLRQADFLPPISLTLEIEQQPQLPGSPLVLRVLSMPGLMALAGGAMRIAQALPPGIRMQDQRIHVDIGELLDRQGLGEWGKLVTALNVRSEEGRLVLDVTLRV
jgi:hypothetical protein